jgi:hypothetical protein
MDVLERSGKEAAAGAHCQSQQRGSSDQYQALNHIGMLEVPESLAMKKTVAGNKARGRHMPVRGPAIFPPWSDMAVKFGKIYSQCPPEPAMPKRHDFPQLRANGHSILMDVMR